MIDGVLDWQSDLLDNFTVRDYTSQITVTHRLVYSVTLLRSSFQRCSFLCFGAHFLAGWRPSPANLTFWPLASAANPRAVLTSKCQPPTCSCQFSSDSRAELNGFQLPKERASTANQLASMCGTNSQRQELLYEWRYTANQFVLALSPLSLMTRYFSFL
jgi:hypothetical protein